MGSAGLPAALNLGKALKAVPNPCGIALPLLNPLGRAPLCRALVLSMCGIPRLPLHLSETEEGHEEEPCNLFIGNPL